MSPLLILFVLTQVDAQSLNYWYRLDVNLEDSPTLQRITSLGSLPHVSTEIQLTYLGGTTFTYSHEDPSLDNYRINFVNLDNAQNGKYMQCAYPIRLPKKKPGTNEHSLIIRSAVDFLIVSRNDRHEVLVKADTIFDYCWIDAHNLAYTSRVDKQTSCRMLNIHTGNETVLSGESGIRVISPTTNSVAFVDVFSDIYRYIKIHNLQSGASAIVVRVPNETIDFAILNQKQYLRWDGDIIYQFTPNIDAEWNQFLELGSYQLGDIRSLETFGSNSLLINNEN